MLSISSSIIAKRITYRLDSWLLLAMLAAMKMLQNMFISGGVNSQVGIFVCNKLQEKLLSVAAPLGRFYRFWHHLVWLRLIVTLWHFQPRIQRWCLLQQGSWNEFQIFYMYAKYTSLIMVKFKKCLPVADKGREGGGLGGGSKWRWAFLAWIHLNCRVVGQGGSRAPLNQLA